MKAIIVFDWERMPDNCIECPLCQGEGYPHCTAIYKSHGSLSWYFNGDKERNPYCPLKPMPHEKGKITLTERSQDTDMLLFQLKENLYSDGWNACIDAIIGGTDGTKGEITGETE